LRIASIKPPSNVRTPLSASALVGVGHPVQPLADVRRTDARSAEIRRPEGVARSFQVSVYKVEPSESVLARNLLTHDDARVALFDEVMERRPKVPLVSKPHSFACRAERLTGARSCPNFLIVGPSSGAQGMTPDADAGEEVALRVASQVAGCDIFDASLVDIAGGDVPRGDQVAQPRCCEGVELVVVGGHG
jgi:hypothetical protein